MACRRYCIETRYPLDCPSCLRKGPCKHPFVDVADCWCNERNVLSSFCRNVIEVEFDSFHSEVVLHLFDEFFSNGNTAGASPWIIVGGDYHILGKRRVRGQIEKAGTTPKYSVKIEILYVEMAYSPKLDNLGPFFWITSQNTTCVESGGKWKHVVKGNSSNGRLNEFQS